MGGVRGEGGVADEIGAPAALPRRGCVHRRREVPYAPFERIEREQRERETHSSLR